MKKQNEKPENKYQCPDCNTKINESSYKYSNSLNEHLVAKCKCGVSWADFKKEEECQNI
jgi:hypothetical protein